MRNLHIEGIYCHSESFISILSDLGITVSPKKDGMAIRRFLLGERLVPIPEPVRIEIKRSIEIPASSQSSNSLDSFFSEAKEALSSDLKSRGIDPNKVTICPYESDGESMFEIEYMSPETDEELAIRQDRAKVFNKILAKKDEIYAMLDKDFTKA
jgi:hypothetical protein